MKIPEGLTGKDLFSFLVDNKKELINEKKSMPVKWADGVCTAPAISFKTKSGAIKAEPTNDTEDPTSTDILRVEVIANTCNWMDSHRDVLLTDSSKRTIQQRKGLIVHISNHDYRIQAKVGEVVDVQLRSMPWTMLGVNIPGNTQCIVFITDVMKSYDEKIFNQYKTEKIQQHSIGLQYMNIELAINDTDYEKEQDFWNKHIDLIGNKQEAIDAGYFWVVSEIKLLENSSVLFGSNVLTETISVTPQNQKQHSSLATLDEAPAPEDTVKFGFSSLSKLI